MNTRKYFLISVASFLIISLFYSLSVSAQTSSTSPITIQLNKGQNAFSIPFKTFSVDSSSCESNIVLIAHFNYPNADVGKKYRTDRVQDDAFKPDFSKIIPGAGYVVITNADCTLTITGSNPVSVSDISYLGGAQLKKGYNMVGSTADTFDIFQVNQGCTISRLIRIDNSYDSAKGKHRLKVNVHSDANPIKIESGKSYLVQVADDCVLVSSSTPPASDTVSTVAGTETQVPQAIPSDSLLEPTPLLQ